MRTKLTSCSAVLAVVIAITSSSSVFAAGEPKSNQFWWPEQLDLSPLRQHAEEFNPLGDDFNYAEEFASLDLAAVKKDINVLLTGRVSNVRF